jgi:beta-N-acetylhexosaminidase
VVEGDLEAALPPFRAAIEAGVQAIMVGHLVVPELDEAPATVSRPIVTGLLREELGFDGQVVSDALEMRAIADTAGIVEGAVRALAAGVDALCLGRVQGENVVESVHAAIVGAVRSGRLEEDRVAEAAGRARATTPRKETPSRELGREAARRALRVEGEVAVDAPPIVLELRPEPSIAAGPVGKGLGAELKRRMPETEVVVADQQIGIFQGEGEGRPLVLVLRDAARHDWQQRVAAGLLRVWPETVIVETGLPGWRPDGAMAWIETNGAARSSLAAAAELIAGR